jgi:hypothetical protein
MSSKLMLSLPAAFALSAVASAPARADRMPSGEGREVTQSQHDDLGGRMTRWEMVATLSGGAGAGPIAKRAPLQLSFATKFAGVDAEQCSIWEGRLSGSDGGRLRFALRQIEPPEAAANPVWHVRAHWEVGPGADAHAFVAELEGAVDWKAGTAHLSGVITSGWMKGTWMEAEVRFVEGDAQGTLHLVQSRT